MPDVLFSVVTDKPERALADALRCAMTNKPSFVTLVSDPIDIDRMPNGVKCQGMFYSKTSPSLDAFRSRRSFGGLVWLDDADRDWINDWVHLHVLAAEERAKRYPGTMVDPAETPAPSLIVRSEEPIQNMILTQRWT